MTPDAPFIQEQTASFGRILRKRLGKEARSDEEENGSTDHNGFPHKKPPKTTVKIAELTMQN
jgi:hypothetical protein